MDNRRDWVAVARGDKPADLVLTGGRVLSVFTGEVFSANVAITDGYIVGVGEYDGPITFDVTDTLLVPGFIDGHCHIESSKLNVDEFAGAVVATGTTSVVVDPHELANVLGTAGVEYVLAASESVPLNVFVTLPSCVPASRFESPVHALMAEDLAELLNHPRVIGIAEMMNFPAAIAGEPTVLSKTALKGFEHVDGHAPGVAGKDLNAYLVAGPSSDHECITLTDALAKKRLGMWIMIREASMIRNLIDLIPLVQKYGTDNCMFVTDDREAGTLLHEGHMNSMVRLAVDHGVPLGDAVKLASLNVARYHGLTRQGAVAPGYVADITVMPDDATFKPLAVFKAGGLVARDGHALPFRRTTIPDYVKHTVNFLPVQSDDFAVVHHGGPKVRVIELVPDQVFTRSVNAKPRISAGCVVADPDRDLAKLAVIERHHATGRVGLGFVRGFGLKEGAFAATVAHDAHNIVVAGVEDSDMAVCVQRLGQIGGGLVVSRHGHIVGELVLPIAGLMSALPIGEVVSGLEQLERILKNLGVSIATPFMYLGFLALSVIPELRLTDLGLVDVRIFDLVPLEVA